MKRLRGLLLIGFVATLSFGATAALYLHHERSTQATVEADCQNREVCLDKQNLAPLGRFNDGTLFHVVTQEKPNVNLTGTLAVTGAATFSNNVTLSARSPSTVLWTNGSSQVTTNTLTGTGTVLVLQNSPTFTGTIATPLTASRTVITDGSGNFAVNTETGTSSHVRATSPTLVTPTLGVFSATSGTISGNLTQTGRINVNGAVDNATYAINIATGSIALTGSLPFIDLYSTGLPGSANRENLGIFSTAGVSHTIQASVSGTGQYRDILLKNNGSTQLTVSATSGVTLNTSVANVVTTLTGNTTLDATHHTINADATSGSFTITLPLASSCVGRVYDIHKTDFTLNTISITSGSGTDWSTPTLIGNANNSNISVKSIGNTWQYETYIDKGTWTATITGCTSAPTAISVFFRIGNHVTIDIPILSATSNANTFTYTGVPSTLSPGTVHFSIPSLTDNSATIGPSSDIKASYNTSTITFYKSNSSTGFTTSGTKGTPVRFELEFMQ